jgi:hypothetical protein
MARQFPGRHRLGVEGVEQRLELDGFDLAAFQLKFDFWFHFVSDGEFESDCAYVLKS